MLTLVLSSINIGSSMIQPKSIKEEKIIDEKSGEIWTKTKKSISLQAGLHNYDYFIMNA